MGTFAAIDWFLAALFISSGLSKLAPHSDREIVFTQPFLGLALGGFALYFLLKSLGV